MSYKPTRDPVHYYQTYHTIKVTRKLTSTSEGIEGDLEDQSAEIANALEALGYEVDVRESDSDMYFPD